MIEMGAQENVGTGVALYETSTLKAVVEAYAQGVIKLDVNTRGVAKDDLRYAPSFVPGNIPDKGKFPYTVGSIASFLGWTRKDGQATEKVRIALRALELIEEKLLDWDAFKGLTITQAEPVVEETMRVRGHGAMGAAQVAIDPGGSTRSGSDGASVPQVAVDLVNTGRKLEFVKREDVIVLATPVRGPPAARGPTTPQGRCAVAGNHRASRASPGSSA